MTNNSMIFGGLANLDELEMPQNLRERIEAAIEECKVQSAGLQKYGYLTFEAIYQGQGRACEMRFFKGELLMWNDKTIIILDNNDEQ